MNIQDTLTEIGELAFHHADKYGERVPLNPADSHPHNGASDYTTQHVFVSAPPDIDDQLNRAIVAKINQWKKANGV